jgi:hypothetical protein
VFPVSFLLILTTSLHACNLCAGCLLERRSRRRASKTARTVSSSSTLTHALDEGAGSGLWTFCLMRHTHTWHSATALKARAEEVGRAELPLASVPSTIARLRDQPTVTRLR